ncbi:MoaD/ThiS family protein [Candidatus Bathyarchaeota archaeon]|nr:MoaD/ThiS family protein [Candidatus Bathyarchaeota archaeon]
MRITVRVYGNIASVIGKKYDIEVPLGANVGTLVNKVGEQTGQRPGYLGEFKVGSRDFAIILNGRNVETLKGIATPLEENDEIVIVQPTAGG